MPLRTVQKQFDGVDGIFELTVFNPLEVFSVSKLILKALKIDITSISVVANINNFLNHFCELEEKTVEEIVDKLFSKLTYNSQKVNLDLFAGNIGLFFSVISWIVEENRFFGDKNISQVVKTKVAEYLEINDQE